MNHKPVQVRRRVAVMALALTLIIGALMGSLVAVNAAGAPVPGRAVPVFLAAPRTQPAPRVSFEAGFSPMVRRVLPTVVSVSSSKIVRPPQRSSSTLMDPFFQQLFGDRFQAPRKRWEQSLGSGVVVSPDGYLLTNNHVVAGATDITVTFPDRREFTARIIGRDPQTDIAVLKVDAKGLPVLPFGDSSRLAVGDFVLAIGNPYGLSHTVTMGIVSATGRQSLDIEDYEDFIQTDAAINPGNSGGALVDERGALIGINTAILSGGQDGGSEGIGFAIPINMARQVMDQILRHGRVVRGYMGVYVQDVTPEIAKAFGLREIGGALIGGVTDGSPAAQAGLKRGDIILAEDGKRVSEAGSMRLHTSLTKPGTTVRLTVFRKGARIEVPLTLGELPVKPDSKSDASPDSQPSSALDGVKVDELTPGIDRALHLPSGTQGVVISEVDTASRADEAGLQRGDVIVEVNHKAVTGVSEYENAVQAAGSKPVLLLIDRRGQTSYLVLQP
jgi:serine protease Do